MKKTFTLPQVEAALCIWEWVNECSLDASMPGHEALRRYGCEHGTVAMRFACIALAEYCDDVYERLPKIRDCFTFDWDIIPEIVGTIDWSVDPPRRLPKAEAARRVGRELRRRMAKFER